MVMLGAHALNILCWSWSLYCGFASTALPLGAIGPLIEVALAASGLTFFAAAAEDESAIAAGVEFCQCGSGALISSAGRGPASASAASIGISIRKVFKPDSRSTGGQAGATFAILDQNAQTGFSAAAFLCELRCNF